MREYDEVGNIAKETDRNGRVRTFSYDALNRRTSESWLDANDNPFHVLSYEYDEVGNVLEAGDQNGTYSFIYDDLNRTLESHTGGLAGGPAFTLNFGYDAVGNRLFVEDADGVRIDSAYDSRDLLESRRWSGGGVDPARVDFLYNAIGERTAAIRFSDLDAAERVGSSAYVYNANGVVSQITHRNALDEVSRSLIMSVTLRIASLRGHTTATNRCLPTTCPDS